MTPEQAHANLEYLLATRDERLTILGEVCQKRGVDLQAGLSGEDVRGFLDQLHRWMVPTFRETYDEKLAQWDVWLRSDRAGEQIVFSLMMDVAIVLGELILRKRPTFNWALDLEPENVDMMSYKRPIVQIAKGGVVPAPIIIDVEALVVEQYRKVPQRIFGTANELAPPIMQAVSGAYERHWTGAGTKGLN